MKTYLTTIALLLVGGAAVGVSIAQTPHTPEQAPIAHPVTPVVAETPVTASVARETGASIVVYAETNKDLNRVHRGLDRFDKLDMSLPDLDIHIHTSNDDPDELGGFYTIRDTRAQVHVCEPGTDGHATTQAVAPKRHEAPPDSIHNASLSQRAAAEGALELFTSASLNLPQADIHFHDSAAPCHGRRGYHLAENGHSRVDICLPQDRPEVFLRQLIVHELAHAWETQNLADTTRRALMELRGLEIWSSHDAAWPQRGSEHAAEIVMWGIFDRAMIITTIPDTDCDSLEAAYRLLTGMTPNRTDDDLCKGWARDASSTPATDSAV